MSQHDQRKIPVSSIALIDRKGAAAGLPDTEIREARNAEHLLLLLGGQLPVPLAEGPGHEDVPSSPQQTQAVVIRKIRVRFVHEHERLGPHRQRLDL